MLTEFLKLRRPSHHH